MGGRVMMAGVGVVVAAMLVTSAQQAATLTLRSGAVLSGDLVDLGAGGFTFRVNGQDREIRRDDVRTIDFGGEDIVVPAEAKTLGGGMNLMVLRNGDAIPGEFYDVSGTRPLRITLRTVTGERGFDAGDIRRIYMTRVEEPPALAAPAPGRQGGPTATVTVSARTVWTATGVTVRRGQTVRFSASGEIEFSPRNHRATPSGSVDNLFDTRAPMPTALQGALIGRIGAMTGRGGGQAILIGNQPSVVMPADGQLFLGVNDSGVNDNRGSFTVAVILVP